MKKIISIILCLALTVLLFTACGESKDDAHLFSVRDKSTREKVTATFKNTGSGETLEVTLKKDSSLDDGETAVYTGSADPALFDRVIINADGTETEELSYNEYMTGWDLTPGRFYPGVSSADYKPQYERKTFDYESRTKDVLIWTPDDYDPSSDEKFAVIYMTDGQNLFDRSACSTGSWGVAESVSMMASNGGEKCIIVGIENADSWRDSELTPDLGEVRDEDYKDGHGAYFSDFVVNTVMPYINENYNVYTDREHTHICGSSSGGIESFYIAMEHPDKFASVGALSPAFILYSDDTWVEYLGKKDFSENAPLVYLYCGNASADSLEQMLYTGTVTMPDDLNKIGYPADQVVMKLYDDGLHNEMYWRAIFPDYLKYAFPKTTTD